MSTAPRFRFDVGQWRWRDRQTGKYVPARRGRRKSDRLGRAVELAVLGNVTPTDGGWTVISVNGAHFYAVDGQRGCNCPDALYRPGVLCKHLLAAALATRRLGELQLKVSAGAGVGGSDITTRPRPTVSRPRPAPKRAVRC